MTQNTWYAFGAFRSEETITPEIMAEVMAAAEERKAAFRATPLLDIIETLHRTGLLLADCESPLYRRTMETMPGLIGFSPEMVREGVKALCGMLHRDNLLSRLQSDFADPWMLDGFRYHSAFKGYIKAMPRGILAHVSAGNVFVGAIDSLIQGLLTKNVSILKMAGIDPVFPILFAEAVNACDPAGILKDKFACVPFRGGDTEVENVVKKHANAIVVYGGQEAVEAYRSGLGFHAKIIEFGPKYSCVILESSALRNFGIAEAAKLVARDFTYWDQSACSSPHTVFIDDEALARDFAQALGKALEDWARELPHGRIPMQEKVEITRARELAKVYQALDEAELIIPSQHDQSWTVIFESNPEFRVSCHHRTAYVKAVASLDDAVARLRPYGEYIQSVGLLAGEAQTYDLSRKLTEIGADRMTELGMMSRRKHGTPHDGTRGTSEFVRWVSKGNSERYREEFDYLPDAERQRITLARLNHILAVAKERSPFYQERLPELPLRSLSEITSIPVLPQSLFRDQLPPYGTGLLTGSTHGAMTFGSGGTTGKPKFVYRSLEEYRRNAGALGKGLYLGGIDETTVMANLLYAGNFWASFLSYTAALDAIGCQILPIGGHIPLDNIINYLQVFQPNGAISIPSIFISIAQRVEAEKLPIRLEKIVFGGEHLHPHTREWLTEVLGVKEFISNYSTNDSGAIAFQPRELAGGAKHLVYEEMHYVEILDPVTEVPLPVGETGKIVITNLDRTLMPVIRYDVGDLGRLLPEKSPCGRQLQVLELLGRSDDVIIIGGVNVGLDMVAKVVGLVEGVSPFFRMMARVVHRLDEFSLEVEASREVSESEAKALEERLRTALFSQKPEFATFLRTESIAPPVIRVLAPGAIPRNPRTGKIRQVVDERNG